jgi:hypothetical protein
MVLPEVKWCKVFKDNVGIIVELAKAPHMHPQTKHINIQCHHFFEAVKQKKIKISHVSTHEQVVDIATTKPLWTKAQFLYLPHWLLLMGW